MMSESDGATSRKRLKGSTLLFVEIMLPSVLDLCQSVPPSQPSNPAGLPVSGLPKVC